MKFAIFSVLFLASGITNAAVLQGTCVMAFDYGRCMVYNAQGRPAKYRECSPQHPCTKKGNKCSFDTTCS
ncbi:Leucine carboxyl methyltransferase 1 [Venturia inaequalis]|nr:Leucine carboxyl methyltransferase 1 [Venturia inaequalis]